MSGAQLSLFAIKARRSRTAAVAAREAAAREAATHGAASPSPDLVPTGPLLEHPRGAIVMTQVRYVRRFFPELAGETLKVGLTRSAAGLAELEGRKLWLNPHRLALHTIAHELVHLLQGRGLVPGGERSADLYALARDVTLVDRLPHYLEVPGRLAGPRGDWLRPGVAAELHRLAATALERRAAGHRQYLTWFERAAAEIRPAQAKSRWRPAWIRDLLGS
jgi:hypothetical protein